MHQIHSFWLGEIESILNPHLAETSMKVVSLSVVSLSREDNVVFVVLEGTTTHHGELHAKQQEARYGFRS